MRIVIILLALACCGAAFSQTFTGKVKGQDGTALDGASVVVTAAGNKTVAFCIADGKGRYKIVVPAGKSPVNVNVSYLGYERKTFPFSELKDNMTITLRASGFKIKEVTVKSRRLQANGDTITYSVAGFRQGQDRSIADVIAKMPGLEVKSNGRIEYQGRPINKFYIEGLDLMGSKYGLASNNLSADKVQSVQVLENHQSVKSLRGVSFSDQAALNLVLKDDAKAAWAGAADIGLGYGDDFLYDCRLVGMRFDKRFQALMMYKNNDTGQRLDNELRTLGALHNKRNQSESGLLSLMRTGAPSLARDRYTFNHGHLLAGNWLWKTGKDTQLRVQCDGYIDKTDMQRSQTTTYLTLADMPVVLEEEDITNTRSEWSAEANYEYNGDKTYIKNNLQGYMDFNKSIGSILYNETDTRIKVKPRKRSLTEDFQMSHTSAKGNVYKFNSYWSYNYLPGQLLTINDMTERLNLGFFSTQNNMLCKLKLGNHYFNSEVGITYDYQSIGVAYDEATEQKNAYQLFKAYWSPSMSFVFGNHTFSVGSNFTLAYQKYKESDSHHLWIDPYLSWSWKASAVSSFSASIDYYNMPVTGKSIYDTPIFTDYRTQSVNGGKTRVLHFTNASASYRYTNPLAGIFFNVMPMYTRSSGNLLYRATLQENIYVQEATDKEYDTEMIGLSGRLSKSFSWAKCVIGLSAMYNVSDYSMLISDEVNDARMRVTLVSLDYSLRPFRFLSVEGKSTVDVNKQKNLTNDALSSGSTTDWEHYLNLYFFPAERWMLTLKNELFHSSVKSTGTNYFCDLAVSYKTKRWELSLSANNLIGTSRFERRVLGNTINTYSVTRLRPREFLVKFSFDM